MRKRKEFGISRGGIVKIKNITMSNEIPKKWYEEENNKEKILLEKCVHYADTKDEAIDLVKEFWTTMPHGNLLTFPIEREEWTQELTAGDRTYIRRMGDKWRILFCGNTGNYLTDEAVEWLKKKGFVK